MPILRRRIRRRIRPLPFPYPIPPFPAPLPVGYNLYFTPDRQEYEVMKDGILYDEKTGRPEIDYTKS